MEIYGYKFVMESLPATSAIANGEKNYQQLVLRVARVGAAGHTKIIILSDLSKDGRTVTWRGRDHTVGDHTLCCRTLATTACWQKRITPPHYHDRRFRSPVTTKCMLVVHRVSPPPFVMTFFTKKRQQDRNNTPLEPHRRRRLEGLVMNSVQ